MKKAISIFLLSFVLSLCSFAQQSHVPSKAMSIVLESLKKDPHLRWEYDVYVKLRGNYTQQDSVMIAHTLEDLNQITETLWVGMSPIDRGNLELFFIDSTNAREYDNIISIPDNSVALHDIHNWLRRDNKNRRSFYIAIRSDEIADTIRQEYLSHTLAKALYPTHMDIDTTIVFKDILKIVYSHDFADHPALAAPKASHPIYWPSWLRDFSHLLLIWPLILVLFLSAGLFVLLYQKVFAGIRYPFLRFNLASLVGLLMFGIFISFFFDLGYRLLQFTNNQFSWLSIVMGVQITILFGLPAVNILWLVELFISRKTSNKYLKSLLLFLSVSLIPSFTLFAVVYFIAEDDWNESTSLLILITFLLVCTVIAVIRALINYFILNEKEIRTKNELHISRLRELKTKAELNALHSKINPHFLYNALNSVAGLSKIDAEKTEHMALMLSRLFRYSINREQSDWTTLDEEINMVNIYLEIEKVRFDDRLEYSVHLPDELAHETVPRFIIQPLVENAIKHGVSHLVDKGWIKIAVQKSDKWLEISVTDNGPGFPDDLIPGFGLQGIYDKLEILYPNRFELHFFNSPLKQIVVKLS